MKHWHRHVLYIESEAPTQTHFIPVWGKQFLSLPFNITMRERMKHWHRHVLYIESEAPTQTHFIPVWGKQFLSLPFNITMRERMKHWHRHVLYIESEAPTQTHFIPVWGKQLLSIGKHNTHQNLDTHIYVLCPLPGDKLMNWPFGLFKFHISPHKAGEQRRHRNRDSKSAKNRQQERVTDTHTLEPQPIHQFPTLPSILRTTSARDHQWATSFVSFLSHLFQLHAEWQAHTEEGSSQTNPYLLFTSFRSFHCHSSI